MRLVNINFIVYLLLAVLLSGCVPEEGHGVVEGQEPDPPGYPNEMYARYDFIVEGGRYEISQRTDADL
jgi:hypothetical protein